MQDLCRWPQDGHKYPLKISSSKESCGKFFIHGRGRNREESEAKADKDIKGLESTSEVREKKTLLVWTKLIKKRSLENNVKEVAPTVTENEVSETMEEKVEKEVVSAVETEKEAKEEEETKVETEKAEAKAVTAVIDAPAEEEKAAEEKTE